ncbi:hypothetical protein GEV33_000389 [Tenebrio molitor]|uniref:Uncharacterized protein n=1 Tax=Tenebrio molitor TaxID=7067 RepID=A0A8J6HY71_TENMO|nr:hypothetical protein GEV33_000389 [Tenebrio molitor]
MFTTIEFQLLGFMWDVGCSRKRSPISSSTLFFYAAHDRRDRSLGPHLVSQEKEIQNRKGSRAADEDTKDKEIKQTGALTKKNCYRSDRPFAGEVTSRPITRIRTKKTFCLKRRAGFAKSKIFFYHPGLDRHGAVDVSGDLDFPRAHGGRRNPGVEFDSALRRLVLHEPSVRDPLLGVWVWTSWTLLPASPSSDPRRLHTLFSPFQSLSQSRTDLTKDQKVKHD